MDSRSDFRKWLWSDWGKPTPLTRLGIPRIVTYLAVTLLAPCLFYVLQLRFLDYAEKMSLRSFIESPFIVSAYAIFVVASIENMYLEAKYQLKSHNPVLRFNVMGRNWRDPAVDIFWTTLGSALLLFLIGVLQFRQRVR